MTSTTFLSSGKASISSFSSNKNKNNPIPNELNDKHAIITIEPLILNSNSNSNSNKFKFPNFSSSTYSPNQLELQRRNRRRLIFQFLAWIIGGIVLFSIFGFIYINYFFKD